MKKSTKLVSAVVVLAVLGGTYVGLNTYVSKEEKTESSSEEESKTEVFSVKTDDIKSLEFIVDKKETTFEKKDDSWVKKDETKELSIKTERIWHWYTARSHAWQQEHLQQML